MNKMLFQKSIKFIFPIMLGIIAIINQTILASDQVQVLRMDNETANHDVWLHYMQKPVWGITNPPAFMTEFFPLSPGSRRMAEWPRFGDISGIILSFSKKGETQSKNKSDLIELVKDKNFKKSIAFKDASFEISVTWTSSECKIIITDKK